MGASSALTKRIRKSENHQSDSVLEKSTILLDVKDLSKENAFSQISLTIRTGEIVGLTGLEGCGKHELVQTLFGLQGGTSGTAQYGGASNVAQRPKEAISRGSGILISGSSG